MTDFSSATADGAAVWALAAGGTAAGVVLAGAAALRVVQRVRVPPVRDVVIVAPHPDDCVILAGEYALQALAEGRCVTIVYVTLGDRAPDSDRVAVRRREATNAWSSVGVAPDRLVFLSAPQSDVDGPSAWTPRDEHDVRAGLRRVLDRAPENAVVVVPASDESHVDHRASRDAALAVVASMSGRRFVVFESAEYNSVYDAVRNPAKALKWLLGNVPVVGRLARRLSEPPTGFAGGGETFALPPDSARRAKKRALIREFASEHNEALDALACKPEQFREVVVPAAGAPSSDSTRRSAYVRVGSRSLHWNVLVLWAAVCLVLFGACGAASRAAMSVVDFRAAATWVVAAAGALVGVYAWSRRADALRATALASLAAGLLWSAACRGAAG